MNNKILILSLSDFINNEYQQLIKKTSAINGQYAKLNNYEYKFISIDGGKEKKNDFEQFLFFKNKYECIKKELSNYDYVVYIDIDACFVNPFKRIEEYLNDKSILYGYQHSLLVGSTIWPIKVGKIFETSLKANNIPYFPNIVEIDRQFKEKIGESFLDWFAVMTLNPYSMNCGFLIFKNDKLTFELLDKILSCYDLFYKKSVDEGCIGLILQSEKYKDHWTLFDKSFAGNTNLKYQPEFYYNEDKNFIVHNAGQPIDKKLEMTDIIINNKWWSQIKQS